MGTGEGKEELGVGSIRVSWSGNWELGTENRELCGFFAAHTELWGGIGKVR